MTADRDPHAFDPARVSRPSYAPLSRTIDMIAFGVLGAALFLPVVRLGFRSLSFAETSWSIPLAIAASIGFVCALARLKILCKIAALAYGGLFALFVVNYFERSRELTEKLKGNLFGGFAPMMVGLEWGCGAIALALLAAILSGFIAQKD